MDIHWCSFTNVHPIGLEIITTAKISNKFHWVCVCVALFCSPCNFQTSFHGIPQIFKSLREQTGVPVSQKSGQENYPIWRSKYFKSDLLRELSLMSIHSCLCTHPRVEWRGLKETSIHQKIVSCILRFQSIWVGISGDNPSFRVHKREKTHALYAYQMLSALSCTHVGPFNHVLSLMSIHLIFPPMSIHSCPFTDDNWEMIHLFANN